MDTLCISPRGDSEDQKFLRKKAIHRMALIYAGAEQVLVLDAELDKLTRKGKPRELIDALISYSRWSGRCWTLEEGALARKCLFQFKDAAMEAPWHPKLDEQVIVVLLVNIIYFLRNVLHIWPLRKITLDFAHDYLRRELATAALRSTQTDIGHASHANRRIAPGQDLQVDKFVRTWNEIGRRSTTRPEDIHPIIANLTDFSAAQIMGLETPVLRTKTIAHCIGRFPLDILWTPCARPQGNGNCADRWIPSTPGPEPLMERAKLTSTGKGLVVDTENNSEHPEIFWIPRGMVAPRFCFRWPQYDQKEFWCVIECIMAENDALPRSASKTACLILSPNTVNEDTTSALPVLRGARFLVTGGYLDMSESLYLRYDCPLIYKIQRHRPDVEEIRDTPIMTVDIVSRSQKLIIESSE
ncbi:HET domain-containing protein [Lasiodiplodia theobromae]|uniref:HET domain-containing protein n=1 Tax=Lasiodiplodia theobromae TaxID=45133 RepID=UPI0015C2C50D|nr:HET domain-containing protein [Lasiodiplodia theobromae]KAF4546253.1 HET domain-containing protein [Lasiodiplodia theobromae]